MAKLYKVLLVVFVVQTSIQDSISMHDIYRGDRDIFSTDILARVPGKCDDYVYCSCKKSRTFILNQTCVKDDDLRIQLGCSPFIDSSNPGRSIPIRIVLEKSTAPLLFHFWVGKICSWNSMEYAVRGDDWQPTEIDVGDISLYLAQTDQQTLRINNPNALLSTFPGMLLKIKLECYKDHSSESERTDSCLLLKIAGKTNLTSSPVLPPAPTASKEPTVHSQSSTYQPPMIMKTAVNVEKSTPPSTPASSSTTNQITVTRDQEVDRNVSTTTSVRLPASTTLIPSDPQNDERGQGENDSRNLVPILVPIFLFLVLLIVLCAIFLYRKRQRSKSTHISKGLDDENTLPPEGPSQVYAEPGSEINTVSIYDNVSMSTNTNPNRKSVPNFYELEENAYDYATRDDVVSKTRPHIQISSDKFPSPQLSREKPGSTVNSKDNLGYIDQSPHEGPYYFTLEEASNEHIYDRVTEEPEEHVYSVLEKPI